jgi:hypothetical protein
LASLVNGPLHIGGHLLVARVDEPVEESHAERVAASAITSQAIVRKSASVAVASASSSSGRSFALSWDGVVRPAATLSKPS